MEGERERIHESMVAVEGGTSFTVIVLIKIDTTKVKSMILQSKRRKNEKKYILYEYICSVTT